MSSAPTTQALLDRLPELRGEEFREVVIQTLRSLLQDILTQQASWPLIEKESHV